MKLRFHQILGLAAVAGTVIGTVVWSSAGRPLPGLSEQGPVIVRVPPVTVSALQATAQRISGPELPARVSFRGRQLAVTRSADRTAGVFCDSHECALLDNGALFMYTAGEGPRLRRYVKERR
jgi:hypothetical protein